eukprot:scaffold87552_cov18-Prasinocladus_malaysianus.AAC.2
MCCRPTHFRDHLAESQAGVDANLVVLGPVQLPGGTGDGIPPYFTEDPFASNLTTTGHPVCAQTRQSVTLGTRLFGKNVYSVDAGAREWGS